MPIMSTFQGRLRIVTTLTAVVLGWFAISTFLAETFTPKPPRSWRNFTSQADGNAAGPVAEWLASAAPLRGDLLSAIAFARASRLAQPDKVSTSSDVSAQREDAISLAKESLSLAPHSSSTWLLLANLEQLASDRLAAVEALKMSYLTSSADFDVIPKRLGVFASIATKADADLGDLGRGDIRLIVTQRPDLKAAISDAYAKGCKDGRALTLELVNSQDPVFAAALR
jgi:hypothetical protein